MDVECKSSPVDPQPKSSVAVKCDDDVYKNIISSSTSDNAEFGIEGLDTILLQNQRFLDEYSLSTRITNPSKEEIKSQDVKEKEEEEESKRSEDFNEKVGVNQQIELDTSSSMPKDLKGYKDIEEIEVQETELYQHLETMAGTTPEAPSALCKYRWSKVVNTTSSDIGFYPSYSEQDPILLTWDDALRAYYSADQKIVCGDFHGNLIVEGGVFPVETFSVRTYTFEVDLFIKDELIDDEVTAVHSMHKPIQSVENHKSSNTQLLLSSVNMETMSKDDVPVSVSDAIINKSDQAKDLVDDNNEDFINNITSSIKSEHLATSKRQSPIGDDAVKSYPEFSPVNSGTEETLNKSWNSHEKVKEELEKLKSSRTSNQNMKQNDVIGDIIGEFPGQNLSKACANSILSPPGEDTDFKRPPLPSTGYNPINGSSKDVPLDIYRRPSSRNSDRYSPVRSGRPGSEEINRHNNNEDSRTPTSSTRSLVRATPTRDLPPSHSSARATPDVAIGREQILENGGNHHSSHPASCHNSNPSSRAQSLTSITSEQELGQYMGHGSRSNSLDRLGPSAGNFHVDDYVSQHMHYRDSDRPTSMPSYCQQEQLSSDVRSMTPDNRIRVPQSPDITTLRENLVSEHQESDSRNLDRASKISSVGSRTSSRTITPVASERENFSSQVKGLEDTISNLRSLLTKREAEVHSLNSKISDLRDINRSLQDDLDHAKRHSGTREDEILELKQTIAEKEILATEVVSLRDELQRLRAGSGRNSTSSGISDYSPNNPLVLQRKITDLEGHMRDLQEASESAIGKLSNAENKIISLQEENKDLKKQNLNIADFEGAGGHNRRVEMITLREDLHSLKERNFQLTEENMQLKEASQLKGSGSRSETTETKLNTSFRSDDGVIRNQPISYQREVAYRTSYSNYGHENRSNLSGHNKITREDLAPKDLKHERSHTFDHKRYEMSTQPLLQRESVEQSRLRYSPKKDISQNLLSNKSSVLYSDRSRPNDEISEKLQSQRIADSSLNERKYLSSEKYPQSRSDLHEFRPRNYNKGDRIGSDTTNRDFCTHTSSAALNSKEIFFNLKQKRANQWLQQDKYVSGNLEGHRLNNGNVESLHPYYTYEVADDSDTATDILLAQESGLRGPSHASLNSPNSDDSMGSLDDADIGDSGHLRRRSKSVEPRRGQDNSSSGQLLRSGSTTRLLNSLDSSRNANGFRSVIPPPLVTQHNKANLSSSTPSLLNSSLTQGMRPFAPSSPGDVRAGDVVKFSRVGGKLTQGIVKYVGHLPGRSDAYLGVELDKDEGKHDGTFEDIRYFKCKPNKGVFVAFNKIVMAWAP